MKNLYESILSDIDTTIEKGTQMAEAMKVMHRSHPLMSIAGVSDNVEKLFTDKLDKMGQLGWYSERMEETERKFGKSRWFYTRAFGKWLERLNEDMLGVTLFISNMRDAEKLAAAIETLAKKEGYIKKVKNIRIVGRYFDDDGRYFTKGQLQLEIQKVDKDGNVVKTKNGSVAIMYLFDCK